MLSAGNIYNSGTSCQKFCVIFKYMPTIRYIESTRCCRCLGVQCKVCLHVIRWKFACKNNDCLGLHCTKTVIMHATHWIGGQQQITAIVLGLPIYSIMSTRYTRELWHPHGPQGSGLARTLLVFFTVVLRPSLTAFQQNTRRSQQKRLLYLGLIRVIKSISHPENTCPSNNDNAYTSLSVIYNNTVVFCSDSYQRQARPYNWLENGCQSVNGRQLTLGSSKKVSTVKIHASIFRVNKNSMYCMHVWLK